MAVQATGIPARRLAGRRRVRPLGPPPRWVLPAIVIAQVGGFYAILNGNGWIYDDNLSLVMGGRAGYNWHWLRSDLFGHFEPAHRAVFSLLAQQMPIDARVGLVAQLAVLAIAIVLLERSLRMVIGDGWVPVMAAAYFGFSILLTPQLQWLSSGLEMIPTLAVDLLCVWGYLHFQRERHFRWALVCGAALLVGLAFYEKPLFIVLYLVLIRLVLLPGRLRARRALEALARDWPVWLVLGAVIAAYIVIREAAGSGSISSGGAAPFSAWVALARVFWVEALVPSIFGLRLQAYGLSSIQIAGAVACQVLLFLALIVSVRHRREAWRAWVAFGICALATLVLIGEGRLATFGPSVGGDTRYLGEFAWLVPFLAAVAWVGPSRRESRAEEAPRPVLAGLAVAAITAYLIISTLTSLGIQNSWLGPQARQWEDNVQASLKPFTARGRRVVIAEGTAPWYVVSPAFAPFNKLSLVLTLYAPRVQVGGPLVGPLLSITGDGHVQRAALAKPFATSPPLRDKCGTAGAADRTVRWLWPAHDVPLTSSAYLLITYDSSGLDRVPLYLFHPGIGFYGAPDDLAALDVGAHTSMVWLGQSPTQGVQLGLIPGTGVCVTRIAVAQLQGTPAT